MTDPWSLDSNDTVLNKTEMSLRVWAASTRYLHPRARAWLVVRAAGARGLTCYQVTRLLCERVKRPYFPKHGAPHHGPGAGWAWRFDTVIRRAGSRSGAFASGLLYNMLRDGNVVIHPTRRGARGGNVYVATNACKVPRRRRCSSERPELFFTK